MDVKTFKHAVFGEIRTVTMPDGQVGFVGKDVAEALGYSNTRDALSKHVDDDDKAVAFCDSLGGKQQTTIINESGLYSLVLSSKLPQAQEFKHWVTSEVLPQIRKTGGYIPTTPQDDEKTILKKALQILLKTVELQKLTVEAQRLELAEQDVEIARLTPMADYAEQVLLSPTCYTMTEVAKSLSMTVFELQHFLRVNRIIYRSPAGRWMLYANHQKKGYEAYRTRGEDSIDNMFYTDSYLVWTEKGKEFVIQAVKAA